MQDQHTDKRISERRAAYRRKTHAMMLKIALIFGVPAVVAVVAGGRLDERFGTGKTIVFSLAALAFAASWAYVIVTYRKMVREVRSLDKDEGVAVPDNNE